MRYNVLRAFAASPTLFSAGGSVCEAVPIASVSGVNFSGSGFNVIAGGRDGPIKSMESGAMHMSKGI